MAARALRARVRGAARSAAWGTLAAGLALALVLPRAGASAAELPAGYPASYADQIAGAEAEGRVTVYANTEQFAVDAILKDFQAAYPKIQVDYLELKAADLYNRVSSEAAAGALKADLVWSSAMDLQFKLVDEGVAAPYASVEKAGVPGWSVWQDKIYGVTFEPVVIIYNKQFVPPEDVPHTRADFVKLMMTKSAQYAGKITSYDIERSGLGFFVASHDARNGNALWDVVRGFGATKAKFYVATGTMLEKVSSGEHVMAYNVIGPYALLRSKQDKNIGVVVPEDYTVVLSRSALIPAAAPHPKAARVFLDYLLSKRGQDVIANKALLYSIRDDVDGEATAARLKRERGAILKPVAMDENLMDELEPTARLPFFKRWQSALQGGR